LIVDDNELSVDDTHCPKNPARRLLTLLLSNARPGHQAINHQSVLPKKKVLSFLSCSLLDFFRLVGWCFIDETFSSPPAHSY
jgi:hypothetical protein